MILDFTSMPTSIMENFKGGEKHLEAKMYWDGTTRIMQARLIPGASIGLHTHEGSCEIIFIISGSGTLIDDGTPTPIKAGQCNYCPEDHSHSLINTGTEDLVFYAAVPTQTKL